MKVTLTIEGLPKLKEMIARLGKIDRNHSTIQTSGEDTMSLNHNFNIGDTVTCNTAPWNTLGIGTITRDDKSDIRPLRVAWPDGKYHWAYPTELTKAAPTVQAVDYKVGDIVRHINKPEWGEGKIVSIVPNRRDDIDYTAQGKDYTRVSDAQWYVVSYPGKDGYWATAKQHLALVGATTVYQVGAVVIRVGHPERGLGTVTELRTRKPATKVEWANGKTTWVEDDEVTALPYQKGDSVIRLGDLARGTGVVQNLRTDKTPCVNVHWASGQKTWNELDEIEKGTAPAFKAGDIVTRVGEPSRGVGTVQGLRDRAPQINVHWVGGRKTWNEDAELAPYTPAPTASYKVGDKVVHINKPDWGVGTITDSKLGFNGIEYIDDSGREKSFRSSGTIYRVDYKNYHYGWWSDPQFLAPAPAFKVAPAFQVGDIVEFTHLTYPGQGVVVEVQSSGQVVVIFPALLSRPNSNPKQYIPSPERNLRKLN